MVLKINLFSNIAGITIYPFIFIRKDLPKHINEERLINHEKIHIAQQREFIIISIIFLLFLGFKWWSVLGYFTFYLWYVFEWFFKLFKKENAYRNISFEREAYSNDANLNYLNKRKPFRWFTYI